ncbi:MAG: hypothetical protein N2C14_23560 [Planctomycetales bacterium]
MHARKAVNVSVVNGAMLVAGLLGLLTNSFTVFFVVALALVFGAVYRGDIR